MRLSLTLFAASALLICANAQVPSYVPTDGLVSWYPFNGNANDESGNGNNGTVSGVTLTSDRFQQLNSAYDFGANNDFIEVQTTNGTFNSQTYTYSFWTKNDLLTVRAAFISRLQPNSGPSNVYDNFCFFSSDGNANINYQSTNNNMAGCCVDGLGPNMLGNVWKHIVFTISSDTIRGYLNGIIVATNPFLSGINFNNSYPIRFGKSNNSFWTEYNGLLDDIGIWNRALTQQEITTLFNAQGGGPCVSSTSVSFTGLGSSYNTSDPAVTLMGNPSNGVFIGPGISGNTFDPATAGVGTHGITYAFVDDSGCVNTSSLCTTVAVGMGIGDPSSMAGTVRVYPNPNRGQFSVEMDLNGLVSIQVVDTRGRLIHSEVFQGSGLKTTSILDLSSEAKGTYIVQVQNDGGTVTQSVVIE